MTSPPGDLSKQQWLHARVIFDKVQTAPAHARFRMLEQMCNGDGALLEELRSLLNASEAEETMSESLANVANPPIDDLAGRSVGPYQLDRLLGRGGMGAVYLAHRADGQFHHRVAIKLIDVPIGSKLFRRQFRLERQILAGLSHPLIARLLEGGVAADGELYLAMEYIDGVPILDYCQQNRLSLRVRLLLFSKICSAVQYAHQNLVIHRDLKPANILVDSEGTPHLLDFGTAKLLSPVQEDNAGDLTSHGLRSFTPQYASPEQVLGKAVSTASDIYSLGVILFQLLADVPPYVLREKNTEEMLRLICETQPPKPSAVAVSAERPDSDLDYIVLKALRKEPDGRYQTADQLAADLQAWLDGRPVSARRGTLDYRASKFIKRNKVALGAAVLVFVALLGGVGAVLWQSRMANLQRIRAEENAQDMRQLSNSFLSEIDSAVQELPGAMPVRQLIVQRVLQRLDHMAQNASGDSRTLLYLADAYLHLGGLQGDPYGPNIGDTRGALDSLSKAFTLARTLQEQYPHNHEINDLLAHVLIERGKVLYGLGRAEEAVESFKAALEILEEEIKDSTADAVKIADVASTYGLLANALGEPGTPSLGDYSAALSAYARSRDLFRLALVKDPNLTLARKKLALNPLKIANITELTDPQRAIEQIHESLALWDTIPPESKSNLEDRRTILYDTIIMADALRETRQYGSATSAYESARGSIEHSAAWDLNDSRAQSDLGAIFLGEADTYVDMLSPLLNPDGRRKKREYERKALNSMRLAIGATQKIVSMDPNNRGWAMYLAYEKSIAGTIEQGSDSTSGIQLAESGIESLREIASAKDATPSILSRTTTAMLMVLPTRLRNSGLTVEYAERLVTLTHRKDPNSLLLLAQAYDAFGLFERAKSTAGEGIRLLPPSVPGTAPTRCRVLLEHILSNPISGQ